MDTHVNKAKLSSMDIANTTVQIQDDCIDGLLASNERTAANQLALGNTGSHLQTNKENKQPTK